MFALHSIWQQDLWSNCTGHTNSALNTYYVIMSKKHWEKSSFFRINFDIFRNKIGIYRHFFWEFPDRFFGHFSGFFVSWPNLIRPQSSLTTSLLWRARCDGKEESDGESHPLFSLPITPCSPSVRYARRRLMTSQMQARIILVVSLDQTALSVSFNIAIV